MIYYLVKKRLFVKSNNKVYSNISFTVFVHVHRPFSRYFPSESYCHSFFQNTLVWYQSPTSSSWSTAAAVPMHDETWYTAAGAVRLSGDGRCCAPAPWWAGSPVSEALRTGARSSRRCAKGNRSLGLSFGQPALWIGFKVK